MTTARMPQYSTVIYWWHDIPDQPEDDVSGYVRARPGIKIERGKDGDRPRSPPMIARASFTLDNRDKRFSPENAASPIYPRVRPDRVVTVDALPDPLTDLDYDDANTDYDDANVNYNVLNQASLFMGLTEDPVYQPGRDQQSVAITSFGMMTLLKNVIISTPLYANLRTDEAVGYILDLAGAGWDADNRAISTGDTTMLWWWLDNVTAWDALMQLLETEGTGAAIYESGGVFHFENRNYRSVVGRSTTSQATFTATTGTLPFIHLDYRHAMMDVFNDVRMTITNRVAQASAAVWRLGSVLTLAASESRTIIIKLNDPVQNTVNCTDTTDYVVTAGSLESVTTTVLSATSISVTFKATSSGATVKGPASADTGPQVRAQAVTVQSSEEIVVSASGEVWAKRTNTLDLSQAGARAELSPATALAVCTVAANYYSEPRPVVHFDAANISPAMLDQILTRQISDRITVQEGANGFNGDVWIEAVTHEIDWSNQLHRWGVSAAKALDFTTSPGLWDVDVWDDAEWGI